MIRPLHPTPQGAAPAPQVSTYNSAPTPTAGETRSATGRVAAALAAADPAAVVVVDFDETLFLSNSTEHFLDRPGPRPHPLAGPGPTPGQPAT